VGWRKTRLRTTDNAQGNDSFDSQRWAAEIKNLVTEMTQLDPRGGCWEWAKGNLAEKWAYLLAEMKRIDAAFERPAGGDIQGAIENVRGLYRECIAAWNSRGKNAGQAV
jgi:hypothetical protein